ncbi:polyamine aminopropyltransferase [Thermaerobacter subterraneus]|uniref:Polyamine aminopropyltransferase n=1 Tax=Thermaerobacter subterraneus DSM 13965 TaxID=867903 RepID=K6Q1Q6_9FIRM|nr:polyamine aminopropyltransferase [Thermaerobacter subterraneus]EKP94914.1 spermidine synthase [Thermaerobacter subterraneus DSM 13965]
MGVNELTQAGWQVDPESGWLVENQTVGFQVRWRLQRLLHHERSPYQDIVVAELEGFGRALFLDRILQVAELDEFIYHEMLVHVPLASLPRARRVLIIGGGDGGTLREVSRWPEVEAIDMVELDEAVVRVCRQWLPQVGGTAWSDPRLQIHYADGFAFLQKAEPGRYDAILVDCSDPGTPADTLYGETFYRLAYRALAEGGLLVQQALSPFIHREALTTITGRLATVFPDSGVYYCPSIAYLIGLQAFVWGARGTDPGAGPVRGAPQGTRWYTPEVHRAAFVTPPALAALRPASAG